MDSVWTVYGQYMDSVWTVYGQCMDSGNHDIRLINTSLCKRIIDQAN